MSTSVPLLIYRSIYYLDCCEGRRRSKNLDPPRRRKQRKADHCEITTPLGDYKTHHMEKNVVNPMIMPKRALISDTKYKTNIGMVVSNGAKKMQRTSAATEIVVSSYSVSPNSSSLMKVFYAISTLLQPEKLQPTLTCRPIRRWYARRKVSPNQRSTRSLFLCLEDNTIKSVSVSLSRPSLTSHTSEPGPLREQPLPLVRLSQVRRKLMSCSLGRDCLQISICCSNAWFLQMSVTPPEH